MVYSLLILCIPYSTKQDLKHHPLQLGYAIFTFIIYLVTTGVEFVI